MKVITDDYSSNIIELDICRLLVSRTITVFDDELSD